VNRTDRREIDAEAARAGRVYAAYGRRARQRRAWSAANPGNRAIRAELLSALLEEAEAELASGGQVLDVGCGTGFWLEALYAWGVDRRRLCGVDIRPERVEAVAARVPGVSVSQADARALPFEDSSFVVVLLFTVLSSLASATDVHRALGEARRVLDPSGVLLVYEPRWRRPLRRRARGISDTELERSGISPRRERVLTLVPPLARRLGPATDALYPRLARIRALRSHRLVVYRKGQP
jgi:SAM-dependent methyltransferase